VKTRVALLVVAVAVVGIVVPQFVSSLNLQNTAVALALAGPAVGTVVALATGRPVLVMTALSGGSAYVSGTVALHHGAVPFAVLAGTAAGGLMGALVALICHRLDSPATLVATLVVTLTGGALVLALPSVSQQNGVLSGLPPLEVPLGAGRTLVTTSAGDFHILLVAAAVSIVAGMLVLQAGPGPTWRAIGSDRDRAARTGLRPITGEAGAMAVAGVISGLSGALAAHVNQAVSPSDYFALDVAALPLLAAFAARRSPLAAGLIAVGTGLVGGVILPGFGWTGPPSATSLALGALALVTVLSLLFVGRRGTAKGEPRIDAEAPWPIDGLGLRGARLKVAPIQVRARSGEVLVDAPALTVEPGAVLAVVGPNGAGKTTLFEALSSSRRRRDGTVVLSGVDSPRLGVLPQAGGGFANCTVEETLLLAARHGARRDATAVTSLALAWSSRLGLGSARASLCSELSTGQRRLLDLARVLLGAPNVLLCDEPLAGLDDAHRKAASACIRAVAEAGLTVLLTEHDQEAVATLAGSVHELQRTDTVDASSAVAVR